MMYTLAERQKASRNYEEGRRKIKLRDDLDKALKPEETSMPYTFRQFYIPDRMMDSLQRYVSEHSPVGDFLTAVLSNDLREAINRADDENIANLPAYTGWLYNEAPAACWGSPERVKAWLEVKNECTCNPYTSPWPGKDDCILHP